jgi:hypothetical protein
MNTAESVVRLFYECCSFPPGGHPDWERLRTLFNPHGIIVPPAADTDGTVECLSVSEFVERYTSPFESLRGAGFTETEIFETSTVFGVVAQRVSGYQVSTGSDVIAFRGINCFQLVRPEPDQDWQIVSLAWDRIS